MTDGTIRFRRRRFDNLFWSILIGGLLAALALHVWLHDLLAWFRAAVLPRTLATVLALSFDSAVLLVLLGFGLPKWIGYGVRKARAGQWKAAERGKWGFHSRDREGPWINYIDYPLVKAAPCADGRRFYGEWLIIHDGTIVVNPGMSTVDHTSKTVSYDYSVKRAYAWDGCTPKRFFFWIAIAGTPDWWHGARTIRTIDAPNRVVERSVVWQLAHHASLVHDALYQYLEHIPLSRQDVDRLFYEMLKESGMCRSVAKIYHLAVRWFGPGPDRTVPRIDNGHYRLLTPISAGGNADR
jgi:hypothetical protein